MSLAGFGGLWLALGAPTGALLWRRGARGVACGVVPFAGGLALVLPLPLFLVFGLPLQGWGLASALTAGLLAALAGWAAPRETAARDFDASDGLALAVVAGVGIAALAVGATLASGWPGYGWDGLAIWLLRAKVLAQSSVVPAELFGEPVLRESHWDYPLGLPALVAWLARGADLGVREYAAALGVVAAGATLGLAGFVFERFRGPLAASLALLPWIVPSASRLHFGGYADPLLAVCVLAGVAGALSASGVGAVAGGIALGLAVAVKNEGALWCLAITGGAILVAWAQGRSPRERLALGLRLAGPGAFVFALWGLARAALGAESDLTGALRFDALSARLVPVLAAVTSRLGAEGGLLFVGAGLVACVWGVGGAAGERAVRALALLSTLGIYLAGLGGVYLTTPHDLQWHLQTSLWRTLLPVIPVLLLLAAFAPGLGDRDA